jgi:tRNA modification GTPase TrmE
MTDTIAAIATATGQGGVGVIRLSGPAAWRIATELSGLNPTARQAHLANFKDPQGQLIDQGLLLAFKAPASYTGEDVVELQAHGAPMVLSQLLKACVAAGARLAEPGEFTRRAYLNHKLDLAQAEAVADLIAASTETAARAAVRSLSGEFSKRIHTLQAELTNLRLFTEATLDFPEEDIEFLIAEKVLQKSEAVQASIEAVLAQASRGQLLNEGLTVVIAGAPNVGKSSLLNALSGEDLAIVTPIAGTTRDSIKAKIDIDGVAITLTDTAGLRETEDQVEQIGIARAKTALQSADLILLLCDDRDPQHPEHDFPAQTPQLTVRNKADLSGQAVGKVSQTSVRISAAQGSGIDALKALISERLGLAGDHSESFIARARHVAALDNAQMELAAAIALWSEPQPALELFAEHLRLAQVSLSDILGEFTADDLLGEIFSRFCIGK